MRLRIRKTDVPPASCTEIPDVALCDAAPPDPVFQVDLASIKLVGDAPLLIAVPEHRESPYEHPGQRCQADGCGSDSLHESALFTRRETGRGPTPTVAIQFCAEVA